MHPEISIRTSKQAARGGSGNLLILRFTPRGLRRHRLDATRSCRISASTGSGNAFFARGGNSAVEGQLATNHPHSVDEREPVGIFARLQRCFMHQSPHGEVRQQEPVKFLPHQVRRLAAQDDLGSAQVGLQFIQRSRSPRGPRCQPRYQAPCVASTARGLTTSSCSWRITSHPKRVRACEIPDLPVTLTVCAGPSNYARPSSKQRSTSRQETCVNNAKAIT